MKITLALLAYNEAQTIENTVRDAAAQLKNDFEAGNWEVLVINDGSKDQTGDILEKISTDTPGVRVFHHNPNRGYIEATLSSLREAQGEYVCIFDGDGQHTAADVRRFVQKLDEGYDVVFGWKKVRHDPLPRQILTRGLRLAARFYLHTRLHDINAGCRGYRREWAPQLSQIKHRINFVGPELYARARLHDLRICEITVQHLPREAGETSHPLKKIPGEIRQVLTYLRALGGELKAAGKWKRFV